MSNIIAIIPARSGSKGVVDKNIKLLAGYPLIAYSIAAAQLANCIDRIIVSTDSEKYARIAREYGAEVPFLRPAEISGDLSTDYDFVKHVLDWMKENDGYRPEYLVHMRPTTPLREPSHLVAAIERMRRDESATALRSVHETSESTYKAFEIEKGFLKCVYTGSWDIDAAGRARQEYKTTYDANGYVDVIRSKYVLEKHKIHGDRVIAYVTQRVFEADTIEDFDYLEYQVARDPMLVQRLFGPSSKRRL